MALDLEAEVQIADPSGGEFVPNEECHMGVPFSELRRQDLGEMRSRISLVQPCYPVTSHD